MAKFLQIANSNFKTFSMLRLLILLITLAFTSNVNAQFNLNNAANQINNAVNNSGKPVTNDEVIKGLKEALTVGTNNSTEKAAKLDGFYRNPAIKIPFPKEAQQMESTLKGLGMTKQVNDFVMSLNRAAEEAAKDAAPIFIGAIKQMTITDGVSILKGSDNAATSYLKDKTTEELRIKFKPIVAIALQKVQVTKYWNPLVKRYNKVPMVTKQNPDLEEYVTLKAIEGLFKLVAEEEMKIRKDPGARVSDLLKKVFG